MIFAYVIFFGFVILFIAQMGKKRNRNDVEALGVNAEYFFKGIQGMGGLAVAVAEKKLVLFSDDSAYQGVVVNFSDVISYTAKDISEKRHGATVKFVISFTVRNQERASYRVIFGGENGEECLARLQLELNCPSNEQQLV